jgi:hypothetical protein
MSAHTTRSRGSGRQAAEQQAAQSSAPLTKKQLKTQRLAANLKKANVVKVQLKAQATVESRASSTATGTNTCVHNFCCASGKDGPLVAVPPVSRKTVLRAAKVDEAFISTGTTRNFICNRHLKDTQAGVVRSNILRPNDDPSFAGSSARLTHAGKQWLLRRDSASKKRRRSSTSEASTAVATTCEILEAKIAQLEAEIQTLQHSNAKLRGRRLSSTKAASACNDPPTFGTYAWILSGDDARCRRWAFLNKKQLSDWVRKLKAAGAEEIYNEMSRAISTRPPFEDAVALLVVRLMKIREYRALQDLTGIPASTICRRVEKIATILDVVLRKTMLRCQDRAVAEALRTPMLRSGSGFGPGDEHGPVTKQMDGWKVPVQCPSLSAEHAKVHCAYVKDNCMQSTLVVDQMNCLDGTTPFYVGAPSETACVKDTIEDTAIELLSDLLEGDRVITDKGYHLRDLLRDYYGALHVKPTEMAKGEKNGMSEAEASRSRKVAQVRSVTERFVLEYKRFDIFNGRPVAMCEWHMTDTYKNIITSMIKMKGPAPDYLGEVPGGVGAVDVGIAADSDSDDEMSAEAAGVGAVDADDEMSADAVGAVDADVVADADSDDEPVLAEATGGAVV